MSDNELDIEYEEYNDQLDPDIYLDNEEFNANDKDFLPNKNKSELDNDDNENDYINEKDEDELDDPDLNDETYEDDDLDPEIDEELDEDGDANNIKKNIKNVINKNKVSFIDNELENDSKIQYIIKNDDKITSNILTIYEMTELIGIRATQIANGAPIFTDIEYINDPIEMAKKEIINNKCPLYVKRYIGLDKYELWDPNVMIKPKL
jgi:DNA-directed RNA polymerase subunit K/omega